MAEMRSPRASDREVYNDLWRELPLAIGANARPSSGLSTAIHVTGKRLSIASGAGTKPPQRAIVARCAHVHRHSAFADARCAILVHMRALSVRQPWAELIVRGDKPIECRSRPTHVRGRIWIYASQTRAGAGRGRGARMTEADALPRGMIVGSIELVGCRPLRLSDSAAAHISIDFDGYAWLLASPQRLATPRRPMRHPQPTFFYPFGRAT